MAYVQWQEQVSCCHSFTHFQQSQIFWSSAIWYALPGFPLLSTLMLSLRSATTVKSAVPPLCHLSMAFDLLSSLSSSTLWACGTLFADIDLLYWPFHTVTWYRTWLASRGMAGTGHDSFKWLYFLFIYFFLPMSKEIRASAVNHSPVWDQT